MSGTSAGGKKAAVANKARHGADFYRKIGQKGGRLNTTGGFVADRDRARWAGRIGGSRGKRGPTVHLTKNMTYKQHLSADGIVQREIGGGCEAIQEKT